MDPFDYNRWERWFPQGAESEQTPAPQRPHITRIAIIAATVLGLFIILNVSKGLYSEWLWFTSLGYGSIYTTILKAKILIFFLAGIAFCGLFLGNLMLATRLSPNSGGRIWPWALLGRLGQAPKWAVVVATAALSAIFASIAHGNWQVVLEYLNAQPFEITDPVFHRELSFYVFSLPFLQEVQKWLLGALIITLLGSAAVYFLAYLVQRMKFDRSMKVLAHLGGLLIAILGLFAWSYWLGIWELVYSTRGLVFGASYADIHAKLPAQWILLTVVVICMVLVVIAIARRGHRWALYGIGGWIVLAIIVGGIVPSLVQRFQVQPNELALETPYIEYNIEFTRAAFALDRIEEESFPAEQAPTLQDIEDNGATINNIRLWDHRPLKDTYNQIQSIRLYYDFHDVDVDRYLLDGDYRQVMLAARELSAEKLAGEAQTWVNRRLQFTHGYGLALSPVNEVSAEGLPTLLVKDIPPVGELDVARPEIYFGEKTNDYVIVNTDTEEFDYPMGDQNVYGHWEGEGGVGIGSFLRRVIYAWQFGDFNILISGELRPESKLLYYRNVQERVSHLAPFLALDDDPYLVIIDGRLLWIQDAYTTTTRYPYSEPLADGRNYIRNSVKAVVDAYDGSVTFYVADSQDALIRTYQAIFPDLFVPAEQTPQSLQVHFRYPEGMFSIQASVYRSYHMRDARVFYNKEDSWALPKEVYAGREQTMEPYYVIMRLPDGEGEEFLLMLPFTPVNKNNTIGWLAARCDGEDYGKLLAYLFPKERLVYGPSQIENRIQQDTTITEQLALWSRGGSNVIRGNLLLIPLGKSNLYVEPVFLQAEAGGLPELKRVIAAAGDQIAMEPTLQQSLHVIFGAVPAEPEPPSETPTPPEQPEPERGDVAALVEQAQQHYNRAMEYLKAGNWTGYGSELAALEAVLSELAELAGT